MRKSAIAAVILAAMSVNVSVFADDEFVYPAWYTGDTRDSATIDADGYYLVYITKDSDGSIVYIDQIDDVYSGATDFLLKSNPDVGKYTLYLGAASGAPKETYFYVGADSDNSNDLYMMRLRNEEENLDNNNNSTWNIGYYATVNATQYSNYNYLKVGYKVGDTTRYGSFTLKDGEKYPATYSGEGDLYLIFQLNNVPAAYKDSAAVYLSTTSGSSS